MMISSILPVNQLHEPCLPFLHELDPPVLHLSLWSLQKMVYICKQNRHTLRYTTFTHVPVDCALPSSICKNCRAAFYTQHLQENNMPKISSWVTIYFPLILKTSNTTFLYKASLQPHVLTMRGHQAGS